MSRPKSLNMSRSQNARALFLVPKYFYIWGIDAFKIFLELIGGFLTYPHFSLFGNFEKLQFFGIISRTLRDTLVYPGTKKFLLMTRKLLIKLFLTIPFLTMEGRGIICLFRLLKLSGDTVEIN